MARIRAEDNPKKAAGDYQYLKSKRGSRYQQLFFGRIRAEVLYRETIGKEPLTPREVAEEYDVPLAAVLEALDYCVKNKELLDAERACEEDRIRMAGRDQWPYAPAAPVEARISTSTTTAPKPLWLSGSGRQATR